MSFKPRIIIFCGGVKHRRTLFLMMILSFLIYIIGRKIPTRFEASDKAFRRGKIIRSRWLAATGSIKRSLFEKALKVGKERNDRQNQSTKKSQMAFIKMTLHKPIFPLTLSAFLSFMAMTNVSCKANSRFKNSAETDIRMEENSEQLSAQKELEQVKLLFMNDNFSEGYWTLVLIDYFQLSKHQQIQAEFLLNYWEQNYNYIPSGKNKTPKWVLLIEAFERPKDMALFRNKKIESLYIEMQLRNYANARQLLKTIDQKTLTAKEKVYTYRCASFLEAVFEKN